jgi:hypothetical protein
MRRIGRMALLMSILALLPGGCQSERNRACCCSPAPAAQCAPTYYYPPAAAPCGCAPSPSPTGPLAPVAR